jgi:hypothetical protein
MARAIKNAADSVNVAADDMSAAVVNTCNWLSALAQRISVAGINIGIARDPADGHFVVNVRIPDLPTATKKE